MWGDNPNCSPEQTGQPHFPGSFSGLNIGESVFCIQRVNYHDDIYGPEVHEVGPHVVSCMLYIQVIVKA